MKTALQSLETAVEGSDEADEISFTATGDIIATDVQAAIAEVDTEKLALAGGTMSGAINMGTNNITNAGSVTMTSLTVTNLSGSADTYTGDGAANSIVINGSGTFSSSDRRLKENIDLLTSTIAKLDQINGYSYNYISDKEKKKQLGVIAQELEEVYPELLTTREDGYKMVNYQGLIPVLLEAIKEQQSIINDLNYNAAAQEERIKSLEAENSNIKTDIDEIKSLLGLKPNYGATENEEKND